MMPSHVFYSPGIYMNQTKHQHIICLSQSICKVGPVSAAAVFFVCFMSAVCCWRLPLMWAIQYQQEFWNGILSSLSGSVSGNLIRRDTYTYNLQFVLIIHIGVLKWQSTINNLFTSGCFVFLSIDPPSAASASGFSRIKRNTMQW